MTPQSAPRRPEGRRVFDLRDSSRKAVRFWSSLATGVVPLVLGLALARAWRSATAAGFESHVDVLSRVGLPTLAVLAFINLHSLAAQKLKVTPRLVSLALLWLAGCETTTALMSRHGLGLHEHDAASGLGIMTLGTTGFALLMALGARAAQRLGPEPKRSPRLPLGVLAGGLGLPWIGLVLSDTTLALAWPRLLLGGLGLTLLVYAAWKLFLAYRIDHDPLRLALVLCALGGAGAQVLLMAARTESGAATLFATRATLLASVFAPLVAIAPRDFRQIGCSLPAQVRLAFSSMILVVLAAVTVIIVTLGRVAGTAAAEPQRAVLMLTFVVLGCSCTVMQLAMLACRRFVANVDNLVDATRKLAQGKLESLVTHKGNNELAGLTGAFNAMAERVFLQTRELRILARVMDGTSEPVLVLDSGFRIAYSNVAFANRTGWTRAATIGRAFRDLLLDDEAERKLTEVREDVERGQSWAGELLVRTRSQEGFESFVTVSPVIHEGRIIQYVAVHRDLSALKRLESERLAFADNLVRLHTVTKHLVRSLDQREVARRAVTGLREHFGITARIWMAGGADRCSDCGHAGVCPALDRGPCLVLPGTATRLPFGRGAAGLAALRGERVVAGEHASDLDLLTGESPELGLPGLRAAYPMVESGVVKGVLELGIPDGEHGRLLQSMNLLAEVLTQATANARLHQQVSNQAEFLEATTRDLRSLVETQGRQAEELREANLKLVEAERLRTSFLSTTSHELRTPISGMMGYLRLILDGLAESHDEEIEFVREAHDLATQLLRVINDVLDIARIDAGRLTVESHPIDVDDLLIEVTGQHRDDVIDAGLDLEVEELDRGWSIHADHVRLVQVFGLLVDNAIKFSDTGTIRIGARAPEGSGIVEFRISDQGIGLAADEFERVLEPFVQADCGDRRHYGGNGLGLTLARDLLALMGGTLHIESDGPGRGITVVLRLPVGEPVSEEQPQGDANGNGPVVILADSEPDFIGRLRALVLAGGGSLQVVATAAEAHAAAMRLEADFVISEFALPHRADPRLRSGIDLALELNADESRAEYHMITAHDPRALPLSSALRAAPGLRVLQKPVTDDSLRELLGLEVVEPDLCPINHRILLVDDDRVTAERVLEALRGTCFYVDFAQRGDEAIAGLLQATETYDVLLIDLLLPGMSLYEILETISGRERFENLAIVVLVQNSDAVTRVQDLVSLNEMVVGAVTKASLTAAPQVLARSIREAIEARQRRRSVGML
ncbi:MAG: response regulator [Planctomycetes bacterium]|nr:response regulator [Planctomycetota bacterium]